MESELTIEYFDDIKEWRLNGQFHREDGPAIEMPNGAQFWFLNGKKLSKKQLLSKKMKKNYPNLYNSYLVYDIMDR